MEFVHAVSYEQWRNTSRGLLVANTPPEAIQWSDQSCQPSLFGSTTTTMNAVDAPVTTVPKRFLELAQRVACHRKPLRWHLLYRTLWRMQHGEPHLMDIATDEDVFQLLQMQKAVTRDVHKTKAFVRFRKVIDTDGKENFVAWHRPDHYILKLAAPFFARRFHGMHWAILTPDESATWDQHVLRYGPGVPSKEAPQEDVLEELWKTYYASIFNPARIKIAMMKREMPVRHWPTLPEASIIDELLEQAPQRVEVMLERNEGFAETATHYLPASRDLNSLRLAAAGCKACHLCERATQTVFGVGNSDARIVIVGEQPGNSEDLIGRPFVGPAGELLDHALNTAGINRDEVYITNVVKHFKFTETQSERGKHRLHKKPDAREIFACRPWLEAELAAIRPAAIVCLGATPSQALLGRDFRISQDRGKPLVTEWSNLTVCTWHPAAILRMPDFTRRQSMQEQLVHDLNLVRSRISSI
jgi:DNA polymerase